VRGRVGIVGLMARGEDLGGRCAKSIARVERRHIESARRLSQLQWRGRRKQASPPLLSRLAAPATQHEQGRSTERSKRCGDGGPDNRSDLARAEAAERAKRRAGRVGRRGARATRRPTQCRLLRLRRLARGEPDEPERRLGREPHADRPGGGEGVEGEGAPLLRRPDAKDGADEGREVEKDGDAEPLSDAPARAARAARGEGSERLRGAATGEEGRVR
jgi:hypothetical protein